MKVINTEVREALLMSVWQDVDYWDTVDGSTQRERLQGLAFSILATLDGCSVGIPEFSIVPMDGTENIGGSLHEVFYSYGPEE